MYVNTPTHTHLLGQGQELVHLDLSYNKIGAAGAERLAGVLG